MLTDEQVSGHLVQICVKLAKDAENRSDHEQWGLNTRLASFVEKKQQAIEALEGWKAQLLKDVQELQRDVLDLKRKR